MMVRAQAIGSYLLTGVVIAAIGVGPTAVSAGSETAPPERPFAGSCSAAVTPLTEPGVFPEVLRVDLDCILRHLGRTTGQATTTVVPAGAPVGPVLPIHLSSVTTYKSASGDLLYQTFSGTGTVNLQTLEVSFQGMETFSGGTGRFSEAVGFANTTGSASFVTNTGFLTTKGVLAY